MPEAGTQVTLKFWDFQREGEEWKVLTQKDKRPVWISEFPEESCLATIFTMLTA